MVTAAIRRRNVRWLSAKPGYGGPVSIAQRLRRVRGVEPAVRQGPSGPPAPPARRPLPVLFADEAGMPQVGLALPAGRGLAEVMVPVHLPEHENSIGETVPEQHGTQSLQIPFGELWPLPAAPAEAHTLAALAALPEIPEPLRDRAREAVEALSGLNVRLRLCVSAREVASVLNEAAGEAAYAADPSGSLFAAGSARLARVDERDEAAAPARLIVPGEETPAPAGPLTVVRHFEDADGAGL